ncbi:5 nucleotidase, partial [Paramuricea clavata]
MVSELDECFHCGHGSEKHHSRSSASTSHQSVARNVCVAGYGWDDVKHEVAKKRKGTDSSERQHVVVVDNPITLQVLQEGCCKAFLEIVGDIEDVMQDYDIAIIDGKSQLTCDDEIPQRRRTFGWPWERGLAKLLFERCAESKYSAEKSTLACASRRCCFQNERLDEIDKEFGVDNYLVVPVEWGWELTGFSTVQDNEEKSFIERDRDSHEKAFDIKVCRATPEMNENGVIAHGPTETVCIDEDECIIIGCISYYHCTMEVDYSWSVNGIMLKTGRKANLVYVNQPGQYQCVVTVNDHVAKSQVIEVVEERSNIAAKEEDNPIDPLALLQSDASSQEKDVYSVDPSTIKKGEVVGQGQFGTVYKGEWRGTEIAIKTITLPPEKQNSWEDIKELQIC